MATLTNWLVGREPITVEGDQALVPLRVPWYRSLPYSSFEDITVSVDGQKVPAEKFRLEVGGGSYPLADLADRFDTFWFVQETARVRVPAEGLGDKATVEATARIRIPYIFVGPDTPMRRELTDTIQLDVVKEA